FPQDAKHGHLDLSGLPDVQVLPRLHREWFAAPIGPVPRGIGVSPRFGATALKEVAVFARRPSFAWWARRSWSVELAIAFEAHQGWHLQTLTGLQKGSGHVPAIRQQTGRCGQQRAQRLQLLDTHRNRCLRGADPTLRSEEHT